MMEDEEKPVLSEVKLEIDIAEEPVGDWQSLHAQGSERQQASHTSSEQIARGTTDVTGSEFKVKQESECRITPKSVVMEPHDPVLYKVKTEPDSDLMEPLDPVLSTVKTEPYSDIHEGRTTFIGITENVGFDSASQENRAVLETSALSALDPCSGPSCQPDPVGIQVPTGRTHSSVHTTPTPPPVGSFHRGRKRNHSGDTVRPPMNIAEDEKVYLQTKLAKAMLSGTFPLAPLGKSFLEAQERVLKLQIKKLELEIKILESKSKP